MAKAKFPFFRWFPADAETDIKYKSMTFAQLGFYHTCLNHSWINTGLPADLDELALIMRLTRKQFDALWVGVGRCWYEENGRLYNKRQEEERRVAGEASLRRVEAGRKGGNAKAMLQHSQSNALARASDSGSDSDSGFIKKTSLPNASDLNGQTSQRFGEWWVIWSKVRGTHGKTAAAQAYVSVVTVALEEACLACTKSYLAGLRDPYKGFNPDNFLFGQARDNFEARWPAFSEPQKESRSAMIKSALGIEDD